MPETTLLEDLDALLEPTPGTDQIESPRRAGPVHAHPAQGKAQLEDFDGQRGQFTVHGDTPVEDWKNVLEIALPPGFDADDYKLVAPPRVTSHTGYDPETNSWHNIQAWWKIQFAHVDAEEFRDDDAERLQETLLTAERPPPRDLLTGDDYFVVNLNDWQFGQQDAGGSAHTVARLRRAFANVRGRVEALRRAGRPLGTCVVGSGGDLVEGCKGFYPMQQATVDLDRRGQGKVVRRLLVEFIELVASLGFERIVLVAVPGNHGENRDESGKAFMGWGDNEDVAVWEAVYDIVSRTPLAERCEWRIPTDELSLTLSAGGRTLGWSHGHQTQKSTGGSPQMKTWNWLQGQAMGKTPIGDVDIFNVFHYHHFHAVEHQGRAVFGHPAVCGSSKWWLESTGQGAAPGVLTYVVTEHSDRPFEELEIVPA